MVTSLPFLQSGASLRRKWKWEWLIFFLAFVFAAAASFYSYRHGFIAAYGDAESHLNIAKRVVDSLTPGFAQLGGIWLPLPHLLLIPFVKFDFLWRTGLAGSVVSGLAYIISAIFLYKLSLLLTKSEAAAFLAALVFMANPNILYLQTTPMTEMTLIVFFILSSYYFIKFLENDKDLLSLVAGAFFGFCAALSRYDGWFLVIIEAGIVGLLYFPWNKFPKKFSDVATFFDRERYQKMEGRVIIFSILAFFGIALWMLWDLLILGDPLYFLHSTFSANSQQHGWLARGELPAYHNIVVALKYYLVTSVTNIGLILSILAGTGLLLMLFRGKSKHLFYMLLILLVPFIFNVTTLFLGQSVIFIPSLTPASFEWRLFNVRYGVMMVPLAAVLIGFLFYKSWNWVKIATIGLVIFQLSLFTSGQAKIITLEDGVHGLSSQIAKLPDAQFWINSHYDGGLVLVDDYARTLSVIRTHIPMQKIIYVGNKPYWDDSFVAPEKYATWIIMQKNDDVWNNIYDKPDIQGRLFKYFQKVYTSPEILIFKRNPDIVAGQ